MEAFRASALRDFISEKQVFEGGGILGFLIGIVISIGIWCLIKQANETANTDTNTPQKTASEGEEMPLTGVMEKRDPTESKVKNQVSSQSPGSAWQVTGSVSQTTEELLGIIRNRKGYLLHVTEFENVASILQKGILSIEQLHRSGIKPRLITGALSQSLDGRKGTTNYVHLAYDESYSMFGAKIYRSEISNPVLIKIDPRIIKERNCLFTDKNAAAYDSAIGTPDQVFSRLDFEKIYCPKHTITSVDAFRYYKRYKQAEILVEELIPTEYIAEIVLPTSKTFRQAIPPHIRVTYADTKKMLSYNFGMRWSFEF
ncbi:MAG TPA: DarT ssDNA thymidine ADP-ribosyltransferase family protein [Thermotogota bacterium]|jgi:hypothetical protein|nr:DarT ssDNA thymidine ADP-ribosyltransferase family protein [Thermotogota bacterium]